MHRVTSLRFFLHRWHQCILLISFHLDAVSVPNRPGARWGPAGGLPRAPDGMRRPAVVRPGRPKGRTAIFGQDNGPYRVRHVSAGQGGWLRTAWDCGGWPATMRVMSRDATMHVRRCLISTPASTRVKLWVHQYCE